LDKDTSGLVILAKNDRSHQWLQKQFKDRQVTKTYVALVDGTPPTPTGKINAAIGRDPSHRKRMSVTSTGKGREAITIYKKLESFTHHTLLEVQPITGRTHQIRVHLSFLGTPVAGDKVYGKRHSKIPLNRHFLHALNLNIIIPGDYSPRLFEAKLPEDLENIVNDLRAK
jgi:23S rRNA pseudouridine1911/1915/1917 synthase